MKKTSKIQIDQSGKIEQTNKDTALCLSNDFWDAVTIRAKTKRQLQEVFRRNGQIRNYVLFAFCAALALLLKRNLKLRHVIVDREYYGKEPIIKEIVLEMLKKEKKIPEIGFAMIGRQVIAHTRAYLIFSRKLKTKATLGFEELLNRIKMTEVGKRLKGA